MFYSLQIIKWSRFLWSRFWRSRFWRVTRNHTRLL